jgi:GntR family transcriptional regulator
MDADPVVLRRAPLPRQVADHIRHAIDHGDYQPGATLPPERLLVEKFQVSLTVIRQALMLLVAEGRVTKVNGKGTVVRGRPEPHQAITRRAEDPWTQLTPVGNPEPRRDTANRLIAKVLDITDGSPLFILEQTATHTATGLPVLTRRILPNRTFTTMDEYPDPFSPRDEIMKALIKHNGPLTATERVFAKVPDSDEREMLKLAPGDLMIIAVRTTRAKDGTPLMAEFERYGEGAALEYMLS